MRELTDILNQLRDTGPYAPRPGGAPRQAPAEPGPAPQLSASLLAYAARDAVREVLPAAWHRLPDGTDTALILAGTIGNRFAARQQAQAERPAAATAAASVEEVDGAG